MGDPAALGAREEASGVFLQYQRTALTAESTHLTLQAWQVGLILHTFHLEESQKAPPNTPLCAGSKGTLP